MKVGVVIPCYQAEKTIERVVHSIPNAVSHIVCVDDCSRDTTFEKIKLLESSRTSVIKHSKNKGVGAAFKSGANYLASRVDLIFKIDADDQMDSSEILQFLTIYQKFNCEFLKGDRFSEKKWQSEMPLVRNAGSLLLGAIVRRIANLEHLSDPANGFFCISSETWQSLDLSKLDDRFFFETSLICELGFIGADIEHIPVPTIYNDNGSHLNIVSLCFIFPIKLVQKIKQRSLLVRGKKRDRNE